jgi:hypothetical protein
MNEPHFVEEYKGYQIYYQGISFNCPALKEFGYAYLHNLKRAMNRKIKKQGEASK